LKGDPFIGSPFYFLIDLDLNKYSNHLSIVKIEFWLAIVSGILVPFAIYVVRYLIIDSRKTTEVEEKIKTIIRDHDNLEKDTIEKFKKHEIDFKEKIEHIEADVKEQLKVKDELLKQNQELSKEIIRLQVQIQHYEKRFDALENLLKDLVKAVNPNH